MTPTSRSRAAHLRCNLRRLKGTPGPSADASPAEAAHLAVMGALDHLVTMSLLELFVTADDGAYKAWPARQQVAILREIADALDEDTRTGTRDGLNRIWRLHHPEEVPRTVRKDQS